MAKLNKHEGYCCTCGMKLDPGQGQLEYISEADLEDNFDPDQRSGWHLYCLDLAACKTRQDEARRMRQEAATEARRLDQERAALIARLKIEGWKDLLGEIYGAEWDNNDEAEPGEKTWTRFIDDERFIKKPEVAGQYDVRATRMLRVKNPVDGKWIYFLKD